MAHLCHRICICLVYIVLWIAQPVLAQNIPADSDVVVLLSLGECCPDESWPEAEQSIRDELELLEIPVRTEAAQTAGDPDGQGEPENPVADGSASATIRISRSALSKTRSKAVVRMSVRLPLRICSNRASTSWCRNPL